MPTSHHVIGPVPGSARHVVKSPRRQSRLAALLALAATSALVAACQSGSASAPHLDVVKVALVVSLNGPLPEAGPAIQAANVALADIASNPHPGGRRVTMQVMDDRSSSAGAQAACSSIAASGFDAVVGLEDDASRATCASLLQSASIPYLAAGPGASPCRAGVFFVGPTPTQRIVPFIDFLTSKRMAMRFGVVYAAGAAGAQERSITAAAVTAAGGQIVADLTLAPGVPASRAQLVALATSKPGMVLDELSGADGAAFETQLGSTVETRALAHAILELDPTQFPPGLARAATAYVVSDYLSSDPARANLAWIGALQKRYGEGAVVTTSGAETYDAFELIGAATALAANGTPAALSGALSAVSFSGPRGPIQLEPQNHGFASMPAHIGLISSDGIITQVLVSRPVEPGATCAA